MRIEDDIVYSGEKTDEILSRIDGDMFNYFIRDFIFIFYHDLENNIRTMRLFNDVNKDDTLAQLRSKEDFFEPFYEIINAHVHPEDRQKVIDAVSPDKYVELMQNRKEETVYYRWQYPDGKYVYNKIVVTKMDRVDEAPTRIIIAGYEVDDEVREKMEVEKEMDFQISLLDGLSREYHTVWLITPDRKMELYRTTGVTTIRAAVQLGLDTQYYDDAMEQYAEKFIAKSDRKRVIKATKFDTIMKMMPDTGIYTVTYKRIDEAGNQSYHQLCYAKAKGKDRKIGIVVAFRDADALIRQQLNAERAFQEAVKERDVDVLTGLKNRYSYERKIEEYPKMDKKRIGCIYIDVDGLHELNNEEGHDAGDGLIRFVADAACKIWGRDNAFRIGGDEFVLFVFDHDDTVFDDELKVFTEALAPMGYSASVGYYSQPLENIDMADFIKKAESWMYQAKEQHYSGARDRRRSRRD